jgi:hypothetical protein
VPLDVDSGHAEVLAVSACGKSRRRRACRSRLVAGREEAPERRCAGSTANQRELLVGGATQTDPVWGGDSETVFREWPTIGIPIGPAGCPMRLIRGLMDPDAVAD